MLFQLNVIPCTDDRSIVTYVLQMGRIEAMLEGKAVNASQVLNYYKHMWKLVSKERTAGNKHTLLLPVLQQKLTSQLLNNTARKAEGESGSRKAEGLAVEIDRKSIYEVEEEMQQ
nr:hypothetical protein CFP56_17107 [Quercus suber]